MHARMGGARGPGLKGGTACAVHCSLDMRPVFQERSIRSTLAFSTVDAVQQLRCQMQQGAVKFTSKFNVNLYFEPQLFGYQIAVGKLLTVKEQPHDKHAAVALQPEAARRAAGCFRIVRFETVGVLTAQAQQHLCAHDCDTWAAPALAVRMRCPTQA